LNYVKHCKLLTIVS